PLWLLLLALLVLLRAGARDLGDFGPHPLVLLVLDLADLVVPLEGVELEPVGEARPHRLARDQDRHLGPPHYLLDGDAVVQVPDDVQDVVADLVALDQLEQVGVVVPLGRQPGGLGLRNQQKWHPWRPHIPPHTGQSSTGCSLCHFWYCLSFSRRSVSAAMRSSRSS